MDPDAVLIIAKGNNRLVHVMEVYGVLEKAHLTALSKVVWEYI